MFSVWTHVDHGINLYSGHSVSLATLLQGYNVCEGFAVNWAASPRDGQVLRQFPLEIFNLASSSVSCARSFADFWDVVSCSWLSASLWRSLNCHLASHSVSCSRLFADFRAASSSATRLWYVVSCSWLFASLWGSSTEIFKFQLGLSLRVLFNNPRLWSHCTLHSPHAHVPRTVYGACAFNSLYPHNVLTFTLPLPQRCR